MNPLYIMLAPLILFILNKRILHVAADIKSGNESKLKADIFFLILCLVTIGLLIWLIEFA